jgi:hypothetical protein
MSRRRLDAYEDRLADKVTARVVEALRDILSPHVPAIASGIGKERECPDQRTNSAGSGDHTGTKAKGYGKSRRWTPEQLRKQIDAEIDTLATRRGGNTPG